MKNLEHEQKLICVSHLQLTLLDLLADSQFAFGRHFHIHSVVRSASAARRLLFHRPTRKRSKYFNHYGCKWRERELKRKREKKRQERERSREMLFED